MLVSPPCLTPTRHPNNTTPYPPYPTHHTTLPARTFPTPNAPRFCLALHQGCFLCVYYVGVDGDASVQRLLSVSTRVRAILTAVVLNLPAPACWGTCACACACACACVFSELIESPLRQLLVKHEKLVAYVRRIQVRPL